MIVLYYMYNVCAKIAQARYFSYISQPGEECGEGLSGWQPLPDGGVDVAYRKLLKSGQERVAIGI